MLIHIYYFHFIKFILFCYLLQANLVVQESKLNVAMTDLQKAQAQLDAKQAELDEVQALYDKAMAEKQVGVQQEFTCFRGNC